MSEAGELLVHIQYIREAVDGINTRLDNLNGRTRTNESDISVLKTELKDRANEGSRNGAKWGAGVGAAISAAIVGIAEYFSR